MRSGINNEKTVKSFKGIKILESKLLISSKNMKAITEKI